MAYMPGDGMLNFEDSIRTVGELKSAIESALGLPTFKQVCTVCMFGVLTVVHVVVLFTADVYRTRKILLRCLL